MGDQKQQFRGLSPDDIHRMQVPLTLIRAQAQMVHRWLVRNTIPEAAPTLARLAMIDAAVMQLAAHIDEHRAPDQPGADPDPETPR